ncbi:EamA family transporter RarD [Henriciella aquimarina]|uniref:EamA family transporter RarD n=1 Tax=Henriciella aquimarina TaxID=545261 RepID=UPI0009FBC9B5|nr:EamA family transporter RarD [Henriciella aquimarina]
MTSELRLGFLSAFGAYLLWGGLPLYFRALNHIEPQEMLAHRILWGLPTALLFVTAAKRWKDMRAALTRRRISYLAISATLIALNWLVYIWAVSAERVTEASLGYYINPLVSVLIGMIFFSETLRRAQWVAIAIAAIGVGVLTWELGRLPWVSLVLCFSFASYGAVRKQIQVDSRIGFAVETALLFPVAFIWLAWFQSTGQGGWVGDYGWDWLVLPLAGPITAVPLILFALAAKRLKLATIGMMQYMTPTIQFLIAVLLFREPFGPVDAVAFGLIWTALVVFTTDSILGDRKARRLARAARPAE